jgi:hypothetical protein
MTLLGVMVIWVLGMVLDGKFETLLAVAFCALRPILPTSSISLMRAGNGHKGHTKQKGTLGANFSKTSRG